MWIIRVQPSRTGASPQECFAERDAEAKRHGLEP